MAHIALYRKYRPKTFSEVVGQRVVVESLKNQIAASKIGHAFLFTGTRGTGKTSCAKIFAKAIRERNLELAFQAFANDPLVTIPVKEARKLFKEMIENTKAYLGMYDVDGFKA